MNYQLNQITQNSRPVARSRKLYPWFVITLAASFLFYKYVLQVSPSVMTTVIMRYFHVDGAGLGNLAATFFYSYVVTQLFVGLFLDKFNPRLLTAGAIALCAVGALLFADAHSLFSAELARAIIGIGAAFATISYLKMAAIWFKPQQFAFVGGLLATAAMIGSIAGQAPLALLLAHVGWRMTLYYCALLGLVLAVMYLVFVKNKPLAYSNHQTETPVKMRTFIQVLKKKDNWYLTLYSGLAFSPLAVFGGLWGNPYLQEAYSVTKPMAASLVSFMFFGLAVGGPVLGIISQRINKRYEMMVFGLLLAFVTIVLVVYMPALPLWLVATCLFIFGFATGAFMLGFTVGKEMNAVALTASVIALINTGDAIFGAFTEPLIGKALDTFWNGQMIQGVPYFNVTDYHIAFVLLPIYLILAGFFLLLVMFNSRKNAAIHKAAT